MAARPQAGSCIVTAASSARSGEHDGNHSESVMSAQYMRRRHNGGACGELARRPHPVARAAPPRLGYDASPRRPPGSSSARPPWCGSTAPSPHRLRFPVRMNRPATLTTLVLITCSPACGDDAVAEYEAFVDAQRAASCEWFERCTGEPALDCYGPPRSGRSVAGLFAALARGDIAIDSEAAQACIAGYGERSCDPSVPVHACDEVLHGTLMDGEPCDTALQCAGGWCGRSLDDSPCDQACCQTFCGTGNDSNSPVQPCPDGCDDGEICVADPYTDPGECVVTPGEDEPCDYLCNDLALVCWHGVCRPGARLGEACDIDSARCLGGLCDTDAGRCVAPALVGESCRRIRCAFDLVCNGDTGVCEPLRNNGQACESSFDCESFECDDGRCVAPRSCRAG